MVDYGDNKITQHAPKVSRIFRMLKLGTIRKKKNVCMFDNRDNHMKGPIPEAFRHLTTTPNTTCIPLLLCLYLKLGSVTSEVKIKRT